MINASAGDTTHAVSMHSDDGSSTEGSSSQSSHFECNIGKLLSSQVDLQQLSRFEKYQLLRAEPNSDPSVYPRTRPYRLLG